MSKRRYDGSFYPSSAVKKPFYGPRQMTQYVPVKSNIANASTRGYLGIEKKFQDGALATTALSATWTGGEVDPATFLGFTSIAQGDGESQRDGRQCKITGIQITGQIFNGSAESAAAPVDGTFVRLILVHDTQTNGAQVNAEDVMVTGVGADANGYRNLQYLKRFVVLKDKKFVLNRSNQTNEGAANLFAAPVQYTNFKMNVKFNKDGGLLVNYTGTTGVIANVTDNSVHLIACYGGAGVAPYITYNYRTRFVG